MSENIFKPILGILFTRNRRARRVGDSTIVTSLPPSPKPDVNISVIGLLVAPVMNPTDQTPSHQPSLSPNNMLSLTPSGSSQNLTPPTPEKTKPKSKTPWQTRHEFAHVDHIFMIVFPSMFVIFNIVYWTIVIYCQDYISSDNK